MCLRRRLGFGPQSLRNGADLLVITDQLAGAQFVPGGATQAGNGAVPADQWVSYRTRPTQAKNIATLACNEQFIRHTSW